MTEAPDSRGVIFNVQHYSIHDGPGIRTTVFLKGCPLRCVWCQNPESQALGPEIFFASEKCTGCGKCVKACPHRAIEIDQGRSRTNRGLCRGHGTCAEVCPNEARSLMGRYATAEEVYHEVARDTIFYQTSQGGVTLSGGEPLAQPSFTLRLLRLCKEAGIHTALETCGHTRWDVMRPILKYVDLVLYDLKHMHSEEHVKWTGASNELALENAKRIHKELSIPLLTRVPIIPGCNDSLENVEATARFIAAELDKSVKVHLLPYHELGVAKYDRLERPPGKSISIQPPTQVHMVELQRVCESFGLTAQIGG